MAAEDGEISDGELESSEDEGVASGDNARKFISQHSEPYALFTSRRVVKGTE